MGGGSHPKMNVTSINGFGNPAKEFQTAAFSGQPGIVTTSCRDTVRTLTVAGTFNGTPREIQKMYKILYADGTLTAYFHMERRQIKCRCVTTEEFERQGGNLYSFVLQFQADNPYFTDLADTSVYVFQRRDLVHSPFTLPCVFTERTSCVCITNQGDKEVFPVLYIANGAVQYSGDLTGVAMGSGNSGIKIFNRTTGAFIHLKYTPKTDEQITVDLPHRKILLDANTNLTNFISDDTVLSNFYLAVGENNIEVINYATDTPISAILTFRNEYRTAVY